MIDASSPGLGLTDVLDDEAASRAVADENLARGLVEKMAYAARHGVSVNPELHLTLAVVAHAFRIFEHEHAGLGVVPMISPWLPEEGKPLIIAFAPR